MGTGTCPASPPRYECGWVMMDYQLDDFRAQQLSPLSPSILKAQFAAALRILHEELRTVGHVPHWGKLEFWSPAGRRPTGLPPEATGWNPRGLNVLGGALPTPPPRARRPSPPIAEAAPSGDAFLPPADAPSGAQARLR